MTQTHDGSAKLWQVWVHYKNKAKPRRLGKPLPQDKAAARLAKLLAKPNVARAWLEEEL